jgi:hypothetical protein
VGLLLGFGQFVTTFAITTWYVVYANRNLDPLAEKIRDEYEVPATTETPATSTGSTGSTGTVGTAGTSASSSRAGASSRAGKRARS